VITDVDGKYTISVPDENSILIFTFVGMKTSEIRVDGRSTIDVVLELDVFGLDEVVVTGYSTRLREDLTGSVSTVSSDQMEISTAPTAMGRIQGQVSGVTVTTANRPGGEAQVRVRGLGTINDNNPLYIIDGVPVGPGNNLNPNDIESISILKDASSAAIYGTRGANGVVIITTKRGKRGAKPQIDLSVRTGISQATNKYDLLDTEEYGELLWLEAKNRGLVPGTADPNDPLYFSHPLYGSGAQPVVPDYILPAGAMEGDPGVDPSLYSYYDYLIQRSGNTDWYDEVYQNGLLQDYNLSITGGGEKVNYAFSGSYLNQEGFLIHTKHTRYTFRNNTDVRFNKWFKAGQSIQVSQNNDFGRMTDNAEDSPISWCYRAQPIIPVYDIMGNFAGTRAPSLGNASNPVAVAYRNKDDGGSYFRILGSLYGQIDILDKITLKSTLGYNYGQWNGKDITLADPEASEPNYIDGLSKSLNTSFQWNWSNILNYNATFADIHKLGVILGTEAIANNYQWLDVGRRQYFSTDIDYMQIGTGEQPPTADGSGSEWSLFSIFGRINYDLMGRYLVEGTVRRDGSSRFGTSNAYGTFPAVSVAWALSQEGFMATTRGWLDFLKIRFGWGLSGNDRIGNYNTYSTYATHIHHASYAIDGSNTSSVAGFQPSAYGNPDVTWETTETIDLGVDGVFLNNTLSFGLDLWQRTTTDMLYQLRIPQVAGTASPPYVNIGTMDNKGFDLELEYKNAAGDFQYSVTVNMSRYVNEITKLSDDVEEELIMGGERQVNYTRASVGTAFPEFYGYIVDGIFQTQEEADAHPPAFEDYNAPGHFKYRDVNDDGVINADDMDYIGSPHPDFIGGLSINLGWKDFDLNMFFYGSYGNEMINYVNRWISYGMFNGGASQAALRESWGSPYLNSNEDATLPMYDQVSASQQASSAFVEDASFLRMKNFQLGYTLPGSVSNRLHLRNLRIYLQATNLFTITKYSGLDPELHNSSDEMDDTGYMGLDQGAWPTPRQIIVGLNIGL
jgi:TonB-linked SusC/RagA family outer membrane protein